MIRKIFKLGVFLLIAHALYQVAPAWVHYYEFKDSLQELALFSKEKTDDAVVDRVMTLAEENHVPLAREDVQIRRGTDRGNDQLSIDAAYVEMLKVVPGYTYRWDVSIEATRMRIKPLVDGK